MRSALQVAAGDRVKFVEVAPGRYEFMAATCSVTGLKGMFGKYFTDQLLEIDWDAEVTFTHTTTMFRTSVSLATDGLRARVTRVLRLPFVIRMSRDAPASSHPAPRSLS